MKITKTRVYGIEESIKASGYPMATEIDNTLVEKDWDRAEKLAKTKAGSGHDCFLKGIIVQADVRAPQYWWLQLSRYHFSDIVSSQSKMHRILKMDISKQCNKYVDERVIDILEETIDAYNFFQKGDEFQKEKGYERIYTQTAKTLFQSIVANCPMGLMLTARITTNYLQLKSMHSQRKNHKLEEWHIFCEWIESLPHSDWITNV